MAARPPKITMRAVSALTPYAANARTHSPEQITQIAASLAEFGWTNPVLIDSNGGIIAGHGRVLAARELGMDEVPTITLANLTEAQVRAYILADNKLALNAGWDEALLKLELEGIKDSGFALELIGFNADELEVLLNGWDSDIKSADGDDTDPTVGKIVVTCAADERDSILALLESAVKDAEFSDIKFK